jgi:hypothetical protein
MANTPTMTRMRVGDALVVEGPVGVSLLRSAGDINVSGRRLDEGRQRALRWSGGARP